MRLMASSTETPALPAPHTDGGMALARALRERRSVREFGREALTPAEISQLLWAGQGITGFDDRRTAPSAGALYPLELYLVAGNVERLAAGVYKYAPDSHRLEPVVLGDRRGELAAAALGQECVAHSAAVLAITAVERRTTRKYGARGARYVHIETGHTGQNICLQATALGLGAVTIGAFDDEAVRQVLHLPGDETALYLIPVGRP